MQYKLYCGKYWSDTSQLQNNTKFVILCGHNATANQERIVMFYFFGRNATLNKNRIYSISGTAVIWDVNCKKIGEIQTIE